MCCVRTKQEQCLSLEPFICYSMFEAVLQHSATFRQSFTMTSEMLTLQREPNHFSIRNVYGKGKLSNSPIRGFNLSVYINAATCRHLKDAQADSHPHPRSTKIDSNAIPNVIGTATNPGHDRPQMLVPTIIS